MLSVGANENADCSVLRVLFYPNHLTGPSFRTRGFVPRETFKVELLLGVASVPATGQDSSAPRGAHYLRMAVACLPPDS